MLQQITSINKKSVYGAVVIMTVYVHDKCCQIAYRIFDYFAIIIIMISYCIFITFIIIISSYHKLFAFSMDTLHFWIMDVDSEKSSEVDLVFCDAVLCFPSPKADIGSLVYITLYLLYFQPSSLRHGLLVEC